MKAGNEGHRRAYIYTYTIVNWNLDAEHYPKYPPICGAKSGATTVQLTPQRLTKIIYTAL